MRRYLLLIPAIGLVVIVAVYYLLRPEAVPPGMKTVTIGATKISVEVAATPDEQAQGLSDRKSLGPNAGMLFPFAKLGGYGFWMKGMNFPLDFIYLDKHTIVEVKENLPTGNLAPFFPKEAVDGVIEVNAGFVKNNNIQVGEMAEY